MRKLLIFIIAFLPIVGLKAKDIDSSFVKYLQDYASFGTTKLKQQTVKNLQNDIMGISHENNYVINFSEMPPRVVGNVSDYTDDLRLGQQYNTTDPDYFDATECSTLNAYLQSLNASIPQGKPKVYVAVNLRLGIIATQTDLASIGNMATFGNEVKSTGDAFDKLFSIQLRWQTKENIEGNLDKVKTQFTQSNQGNYALFYWGKFFEVKGKVTVDNTGNSNVLTKVAERGWYKYHYSDPNYADKNNLIQEYIISKSHFDVLPRTTKIQLREKFQAGAKSLADAIINIDGIRKEMDFLKRVVDYTGRSNGLTTQQQEAISKLLGGQSVIKDNTGTDRDRHTLACKLFITKEGDPNNAKILTQIGECQLVNGEAAIHIHFTGNTPSVKSVKFGDSDTQAAFEGVIRNLGQTKESFWASFFGSSDWQGVQFEDLCAGIYETMDWASKNIEKAKIPEYVWNCEKSEYKPIYAKAFGGIFKPMTFLVDNAINPFVIKFAPQFSGKEDQARFAMLCGVWNGLIYAFKAIPDGVALLTSMGSNDPKHKAAINALGEQITQNGGGMKGFFITIWDGLAIVHNTSKPCEFAHQIGSDVFVIIAAYFTGGESLAGSTTGNALKTIFVTLDRFDVIGQIVGRASGIIVKATLRSGKCLMSITSRTGTKMLEILENGALALKIKKLSGEISDINVSAFRLTAPTPFLRITMPEIKVIITGGRIIKYFIKEGGEFVELIDDYMRMNGEYRGYAENVVANIRNILNVTIEEQGINRLIEHLSKPLFLTEGKIMKCNEIMIDRLKRIQKGELFPTDIDKYFYTHELREAELMQLNGGVYSREAYEHAHAIAAKEYGVKAIEEESFFYTEDAINAMYEDFK